LGTTKRTNPALSLFVGENREWVTWMPRGYYDTSIDGDTKFLGWHLNKSTIYRPGPSDFLPSIRFEKALRQPKRVQPNVLDTLLRTADLGAALTLLPGGSDDLVGRLTPPEVTVNVDMAPGPPPLIKGPDGGAIDARADLPSRIDLEGSRTLPLLYTITSDASPAASFDLLVDGRPIGSPRVYREPVSPRREAVLLRLEPGQHRIAAEVRNAWEVKRVQSIDVEVRVAEPRKTPRLLVLGLAPEFQQPFLPRIPFAQEDVQALRRFSRKWLVSPRDGSRLDPIHDRSLVGPAATVEAAARVFEGLDREPLEDGDLVIVVIESHFLNSSHDRGLAAANSHGPPPNPAINADALARHLGNVARRKCKVLVLIDAVHTTIWDAEVNEWVRHLRDEQNVIMFVASNNGVSQDAGGAAGHRAFAQAILDSVKPPLRDGAFSLNHFRDRVHDQVLALTRRQQFAECFIPETLNGQFPIVDPHPGPK
jgi:hypothetical protein